MQNYDLGNCVIIRYKRMCEQEYLHSERKVLSQGFKETEGTKNFERNTVYGRSLKHRNNNVFLPLMRGQKKTKQQTAYNHLCNTYLLTIQVFPDLLCDMSFF